MDNIIPQRAILRKIKRSADGYIISWIGGPIVSQSLSTVLIMLPVDDAQPLGNCRWWVAAKHIGQLRPYFRNWPSVDSKAA